VDRKQRAAQNAKLCRVLREIRQEQGITQVELAERVNMPQSYVSKYEQGERRLDLVELDALATALRVSLIEIVKRFQSKLAEGERFTTH